MDLVHDIKFVNITHSRPGRVGSVGDTIVTPRLRQSTPAMPWRADPYWASRNKQGSNVQDGDTLGYDNKGGPARCFDSRWMGNRSFKSRIGYTYHDVQSPDKRTEPWISSLGDFSWRRKIATVRIAKRTGTLFSVKPGGYAPERNDLLRGGDYPQTSTSGGDAPPDIVGVGPIPMRAPAVTHQPDNPTNAGVSNLGVQQITPRLAGIRIV